MDHFHPTSLPHNEPSTELTTLPPARPKKKRPRRLWALSLVTIVLVSAAVVSASPAARNFLRVETLFSSLGLSLTTTTEKSSEVESVTATPGLTLALIEGSTDQYQPTRHEESEIYTPEKPFTALGARWHAAIPAGTDLQLAVRTGSQNSWSEWQELHVSEDAFVASDATARVSDLLFVPLATQIQFSADLQTSDTTRTPRFESIGFDFMNPDPGPDAPAPTLSAQSATGSQPTIISRAQWGADESLMDWPPQYASIKTIVVHHTAGASGPDTAAIVRGIYQYHAQTLDWGDIGYNFLIDPQGRIFEGRTGGWGVIGAHALGYNTGSIGISLIGTYESSPITPAAEQSLVQLTAFISAKYDLDPTATHYFIDKNGPVLGGHRDYGQTLCPGTAEYATLPRVRTAALAARGTYYSGANSGTIVDVTGNIITENTPGTATIKVRNTGSSTWKNSGSTPVVVQTADPAKHESTLATTGWQSPGQPATIKESSVGPGGIATVAIPLAAAGLGDTADTFTFAYKGGAAIAGTQFTLTRSVRPPYRGQVVELKDPIAVEGGKTTAVTVRIKNTGAKSWSNSGEHPVALNLIEPKGRTSELRDSSWPLAYRPTVMDTATVKPDQEGTFTFSVAVPPKAGEYIEPMQAVVDGVEFIAGADFTVHLQADNPYQSELNERPIVMYATPAEVRTVMVNITNESEIPWKAAGKGLVALEIKNQNSSLLHAAGWISARRPVQVTNEIAPGQTVSLIFPIKVPDQLQDYTESYQLVSDGITPIDGSGFSLTIKVRSAMAAKVLTNAPSVSVAVGTTKRVEVEMQNIGAKSWHAEGSEPVTVVTADELKHTSDFKTASWINGHTPSKLEPPLIAPDQKTHTSIEVAADDKNGDTIEKFTLLDAAGVPIPGSTFAIKRTTTGHTSSGAKGSAIRIGIYSSSSAISVSAASGYKAVDSSGAQLGSAGSGKTTVKWDGSQYVMTGAMSGKSQKPPRFVPTGSTILALPDYADHPAWDPSLNDNAFRGTIEVRRASNGKLYAINELPLEDYMKGLAEASNDSNDTYLQVLAIAARTYAEYHRSAGGKHPNEGYDLDNKVDQQYKGYNLEKRNTDFVAAVGATRGTFVTVNGKPVVTPYFSQSDGRTRSFAEVFGGAEKSWLVSVQVPENQGKQLLGHGVGLDASAAYARTAAGQSRDKVLKYFYTGVEIKQLY